MYRCLKVSASSLDLEVDADGSSSHGSTASTSCDNMTATPPGGSPVAVALPEVQHLPPLHIIDLALFAAFFVFAGFSFQHYFAPE
jgi:hypothetical protein